MVTHQPRTSGSIRHQAQRGGSRGSSPSGDRRRPSRLPPAEGAHTPPGRQQASVALGYLSEVERGQKEASSEILASVAEALDTPISVIMREVGDRLAVIEGLNPIPDTIPDDLVAGFDSDLIAR